jgi:flagellar biosynthetic protein FliR
MEILSGVVNRPEAYLLVVARVSGLFLFAPVLGNRMIPALVRVALVLLISWVLFPIYGLTAPQPDINVPALVSALGGELVVGLVLGIASGLIFTGFQMAGSIVGHQMGFSLPSLFDPTNQADRSAVIDQFYGLVATLLFLIIDGHHMLLLAFDRAFRALPLGSAIQPELVAMPLGQLVSEVMAASLQLAMPIIAATLLTDLAFGLLSRAVPQINVFFLELPLKILIGVVGLSLILPATLTAMEVQIEGGIRNMINVLGTL